MTPGYPNQYPNTELTLSAHADFQTGIARTPDRAALAVRNRIARLTYAARVPVIVAQLRVMRMTYPA